MNKELFNLSQLPDRTPKPRNSGLTMVMDKGLCLQEVENFLENGTHYTDLIKLGFGTSFFTNKLQDKINIYKSANIPVYLGGTLFEAYVVRNQFDDYVKLIEKLGITHIEVSDGSLDMNHDIKCNYIHTLSKNFTVLSEVGSKDAEKIIPPYEWIEQMETELQAGAWKVIGEARESGTVGIFRGTGEVRSGLIAEILRKIPQADVIWEAPKKEQQVWFIQLYGSNVNLGNIAPNEIIPLETLRMGLRGDSFNFFLNH
ncbi:MAG: phosphosulfolactate synthase [Flavobacteriaceae bacterium]|nr:phosphosulfolactate synthase [Flavobacteriaceae bacterium]PHX77543.1 MAG: phosphosulfolactate synthase [Flavobacteriales bacterium]